MQAIQRKELSQTRQLISMAEKTHAEELAPKTYKQAINDLTSADNAIATDRHNPAAYRRVVNRAFLSAKTLSDVTYVINASDRKTDEDAAVKLVMQGKEIRNLEANIDNVRDVNSELETKVTEQKSVVSELEKKEKIQADIASVQGEFSADEAEVFQQGNKVLIRLKKINFPSGSAKIPVAAQPLLSKVKESMSRLDPIDVEVEGHTDAIGSAKKNLALSKNRAESVAEYLKVNTGTSASFEAIGLGDEKPIASDKTVAGRAQNRRVDIIITPKSAEL